MTDIIDLGAIRASDKHIIQLKSYDPYPSTGPIYYRWTADNLWYPFRVHDVGDWVTYYPDHTYFNGYWNAAINFPLLADGQPIAIGTIYIVSAGGTQEFSTGRIKFRTGDLIRYDGGVWSKIEGILHCYICTEKHTSTINWDDNASKWEKNELPPQYNLDLNSGAMFADLPYFPFYSRSYIFKIRIDKFDVKNGQTEFINQTFKLTIKGQVDNNLYWVSDDNIGSINTGYLSELSIQAAHENNVLTIKYTLIDGELPPGLTLQLDGSITGRPEYTATLGRYNFTVRATDLYRQIIEKDFYLILTEYDGESYTQLYVRPFLKNTSRYNYSVFISDPKIFPRELIYRPDDINFGVQQNIKTYIEYGIQQVTLNDYVEAMQTCFYKKKLLFGEIKTVAAEDEYGRHVYDVVYVEIIDPLENSIGDYVQTSVSNNIKVYPNSIANMRRALELIEIDNEIIKTDEFQLPRWMRTPMLDTGLSLGFTLATVLCYTIPNSGSKIIKNIQKSKFNFNTLDFEIDRLIVVNNLSLPGERYLIFPTIQGESVDLSLANSTILTTFTLGESGNLETEDGNPIIL